MLLVSDPTKREGEAFSSWILRERIFFLKERGKRGGEKNGGKVSQLWKIFRAKETSFGEDNHISDVVQK